VEPGGANRAGPAPRGSLPPAARRPVSQAVPGRSRSPSALSGHPGRPGPLSLAVRAVRSATPAWAAFPRRSPAVRSARPARARAGWKVGRARRGLRAARSKGRQRRPRLSGGFTCAPLGLVSGTLSISLSKGRRLRGCGRCGQREALSKWPGAGPRLSLTRACPRTRHRPQPGSPVARLPTILAKTRLLVANEAFRDNAGAEETRRGDGRLIHTASWLPERDPEPTMAVLLRHHRAQQNQEKLAVRPGPGMKDPWGGA